MNIVACIDQMVLAVYLQQQKLLSSERALSPVVRWRLSQGLLERRLNPVGGPHEWLVTFQKPPVEHEQREQQRGMNVSSVNSSS